MRRNTYSPPPITREQRESFTGWESPYATDPKCDHARLCVEVTETVPNPFPNDPYYLHIYLREWACGDCGAPVNPWYYTDSQRVSNQEERRRSA